MAAAESEKGMGGREGGSIYNNAHTSLLGIVTYDGRGINAENADHHTLADPFLINSRERIDGWLPLE